MKDTLTNTMNALKKTIAFRETCLKCAVLDVCTFFGPTYKMIVVCCWASRDGEIDFRCVAQSAFDAGLRV